MNASKQWKVSLHQLENIDPNSSTELHNRSYQQKSPWLQSCSTMMRGKKWVSQAYSTETPDFRKIIPFDPFILHLNLQRNFMPFCTVTSSTAKTVTLLSRGWDHFLQHYCFISWIKERTYSSTWSNFNWNGKSEVN